MDARYYNGEDDRDWPSVGGFTYAEYQRLKAGCSDCGAPHGTPCTGTCGCVACRARDALAQDQPKDGQ